ncbi:prepilin peptidase [Virgisporangium aurantiacum]|nr:A24 family peptidase [Virgisporangium aurantiacum]
MLRAAVATHSVPSDSPWRRSCDGCRASLDIRDPSMAFSPVGRCGSCGLKVGAPPYLVEAATLVAAFVVVLVRPSHLEALAVAWWAGTSIVLAFVDAAVHRLPNRLTYPAASGVVTLLGLSAVVEHHTASGLARGVVAGTGLAAGFTALTLALGRHGPGLGDAKLMLGTGILLGWLGWTTVLTGLAFALVAQGLWATALVVAKRAGDGAHLPMGPFLIVGAAVGAVLTSC